MADCLDVRLYSYPSSDGTTGSQTLGSWDGEQTGQLAHDSGAIRQIPELAQRSELASLSCCMT